MVLILNIFLGQDGQDNTPIRFIGANRNDSKRLLLNNGFVLQNIADMEQWNIDNGGGLPPSLQWEPPTPTFAEQ